MSVTQLKVRDNELAQQAERALAGWIDPLLGRDLLSLGAVSKLEAFTFRLYVDIQLGFAAEGYAADFSARLEQHLLAHTQAQTVEIKLDWAVQAGKTAVQTLPQVKHMIAVASGKGGVGKSTSATNLALALAADGARVGMLDADLYGPSQPRLLGISGLPETRDGLMEPMLGHGLQTMSIGFLVDDEAPVIWRGPMITQALTRLLNETRWQQLDYLIVDMPPGTGDIHMTMAQRMPVSGAVIITTPQDIALLDARKGLKMFEKVNIPVLGIVENMSTHVCSNCGHHEPIFGSGGARRMVEQYQSELLGELPLDIRIRSGSDEGMPIVLGNPQGEIAQAYRSIARRVAAKLWLQEQDTGAALPSIVVE